MQFRIIGSIETVETIASGGININWILT